MGTKTLTVSCTRSYTSIKGDISAQERKFPYEPPVACY